MKIKNHCDLASCFLCRLSLKDWIPAIEQNKKTILFKKGEVIFKEGDPVTGIYFVYAGTVKVHKNWGKGKELILRFAKSGSIVGHRGLGADSVYPVSATAIDAVTMCFITLPFFESTLRVNNELLFQLMMFYARELQESEKNMRNLAHMPVKGRVVQALLFLKDRFGIDEQGCLNLDISRQNLASFTGTTYESVFRILNELSEANLMRLIGKRICLTDTAGMEKMMEDLT
jgi:CRP/FNR family transcriptional regulator